MSIAKTIFKTLFGILIGIATLRIGWVFWVYFAFSFGTPGVGIWITFSMLGYIWMCIELARFKKWAWMMFTTIIVLAMVVEFLFVVVGRAEGNLVEGLYHSIFWVSLVAIPAFGISAIIRGIIKRRKERKTDL